MTAPSAVVTSPPVRLPLPVTLGTAAATFTEWLPGHAKLTGVIIAADTETTVIDETHPWMTPTLVLMQAYDGERGVFVAPANVPAFMAAHGDCFFTFHNAAFDLRVIDKTLSPAIAVRCPVRHLHARGQPAGHRYEDSLPAHRARE